MVNTGQPSDGCIKCKTRRIKCDAIKPSCGNCFKIHSICPGYPEPTGIRFRDDTVQTKVRAEKMYRNLENRNDEPEANEAENGSSPSSAQSTAPRRRKSPSGNGQSTPMAGTSSSEALLAGSIQALSQHLNMRDFTPYVDRINDAVALYPRAIGPLRAAVEILALTAFAQSPAATQDDIQSTIDYLKMKVLRETREAIDQLHAGNGNPEQLLLAVEITLLVDCHFGFRSHSAVDAEVVFQIHLRGMGAIIVEAGLDLLQTELGRSVYVNAFMFHLHTYSPMMSLPPIPGPETAIEVLLQHKSPPMQEYRALQLLQRSYNLRSHAMLVFTHLPEPVDLEFVTNLKLEVESLRQDFEDFWARLSAARKFGGPSMWRWIINMMWSHRILLEDTIIMCLRTLRHLHGETDAFIDTTELAIQNTRFAVQIIRQGLPYSFTEADVQSFEEAAPTYQDLLLTWNSHDHLLICSMVDVLSEEEHMGITYARIAFARAAGLRQPILTRPRQLLKLD